MTAVKHSNHTALLGLFFPLLVGCRLSRTNIHFSVSINIITWLASTLITSARCLFYLFFHGGEFKCESPHTASPVSQRSESPSLALSVCLTEREAESGLSGLGLMEKKTLEHWRQIKCLFFWGYLYCLKYFEAVCSLSPLLPCDLRSWREQGLSWPSGGIKEPSHSHVVSQFLSTNQGRINLLGGIGEKISHGPLLILPPHWFLGQN